MTTHQQPARHIIITETKWLGRYFIKAECKVNRITGQNDVNFKKWINGRWIHSQQKLMPGYWTRVQFHEFELHAKIKKVFSHLIEQDHKP